MYIGISDIPICIFYSLHVFSTIVCYFVLVNAKPLFENLCLLPWVKHKIMKIIKKHC